MRQAKPPEPGADTGSRLQRDKPNSPHRGRRGSAQERADRAAARAAKIEEREASRAAAYAAAAAMDAQATVLAAERAAPKVVAARKEELDLEQQMQLVCVSLGLTTLLDVFKIVITGSFKKLGPKKL